MSTESRCHACGHKRNTSVNSARAYLLRRLRDEEPISIKTFVDEGVDTGLDKATLLDAVRTASSFGDITIDKDWRMQYVRRK